MNGWLDRWLSRFGYVQLMDSTKVPPRLMAVAGCAIAADERDATSAAVAPRPVSNERRVNSRALALSVIRCSFPSPKGAAPACLALRVVRRPRQPGEGRECPPWNRGF